MDYNQDDANKDMYIYWYKGKERGHWGISSHLGSGTMAACCSVDDENIAYPWEVQNPRWKRVNAGKWIEDEMMVGEIKSKSCPLCCKNKEVKSGLTYSQSRVSLSDSSPSAPLLKRLSDYPSEMQHPDSKRLRAVSVPAFIKNDKKAQSSILPTTKSARNSHR
eukprot:UN26821